MTPSRFTPTQTFRGILQLAIAGVLIGALLFGEANLPFSVIGLCVILLLWLVIKTSAMPLLVTAPASRLSGTPVCASPIMLTVNPRGDSYTLRNVTR